MWKIIVITWIGISPPTHAHMQAPPTMVAVLNEVFKTYEDCDKSRRSFVEVYKETINQELHRKMERGEFPASYIASVVSECTMPPARSEKS